MKTKPGTWHQVAKSHPCPVCGKTAWCLYTGPADAPHAVLCTRVESPKQHGAAWLHELHQDGPTWAPWRQTIHAAVRMMNESKVRKPSCTRRSIGSARHVSEVLPELLAKAGCTLEELEEIERGAKEGPCQSE